MNKARKNTFNCYSMAFRRMICLAMYGLGQNSVVFSFKQEKSKDLSQNIISA